MPHHTFVLQRSASKIDDVLMGRVQRALLVDTSLTMTTDWGGCPAFCYITDEIGGPVLGPELKTSSVRVGEEGGGAGDVSVTPTELHFSCDHLGSRTLWYHVGSNLLVVSTSQKAIVALKGSYLPCDEAVAWFLSSGCQGPFVSWDGEIRQVRPDLEYRFDICAWRLSQVHKRDMAAPRSGTGCVSEYLECYETTVTANIERTLHKYGEREVLLPLSGGLDSRLILALARNAGVDAKLQLVNWGVPASDGVFDDMVAASQVAKRYGKSLIRGALPEVVDDPDLVLDRYVSASEGRIDHFNGYTDGFAMWDGLAGAGFRCILRGDIPFTEGLDVNKPMARAHLGLERLDDYSNVMGTPLADFAPLQVDFDIRRQEEESLVRWRDRLYTQWRVPMTISAFSDLVGGHVDNRLPMMSWQLYCGYMALPDSKKGNKAHIESLCRKHDRTRVPFNAIGALRAPAAAMDSPRGAAYVARELARIRESGRPYSHLTAWVGDRASFGRVSTSGDKARKWGAVRGRFADALPPPVKGWLKARRPRLLSLEVVAYRLILVDKIQAMYAKIAQDSEQGGILL